MWTCGGIGLLIILIIIGIFAFRFFSDSGTSTATITTKPDEEDIEMSKADLIDYFVTETTVWAGTDYPMKVTRFEKPIVKVSIADTPPEGGIQAVDDFIAKFNTNSNTVKLERTQSDGDIKIYFQKDTKGAAGRSGPSGSGNYIIDHANVKLDQKVAIFDQSMSSVLSHEMFHALGFTGHYNGSVCRLMSPTVCGSHFSINEERLIQMLYSTDIPIKSDESDIRTYFQNWEPK